MLTLRNPCRKHWLEQLRSASTNNLRAIASPQTAPPASNVRQQISVVSFHQKHVSYSYYAIPMAVYNLDR